MVATPHSLTCCFCGAVTSDVELLFVSSIGGLPPTICSGCVEGFNTVLSAYRLDAPKTAQVIAALNKSIKPQPNVRRTA